MKVISGEQSNGAKIMEDYKSRKWGRMFVTRTPTPYPGEPWGFDNGAFGAWLRQRPFPAYDFEHRLIGLEQAPEPPYLAVLPDIVGQGLWSLEFSLGYLDKVPPAPWYLVAQDGMVVNDVRPVLIEHPEIVGIFLGGTTRFKETAAAWARLARRTGVQFHYGRAGVLRRIYHARRICANSLDSAFPLWTKERFSIFVSALESDESSLRLMLQPIQQTLFPLLPEDADFAEELLHHISMHFVRGTVGCSS